jgi:hypothetical protein
MSYVIVITIDKIAEDGEHMRTRIHREHNENNKSRNYFEGISRRGKYTSIEIGS